MIPPFPPHIILIYSTKAKCPKLLLMSATLDTELFVKYFQNVQPTEIQILRVGARRFPVQTFYLETLASHPALKGNKLGVGIQSLQRWAHKLTAS